VVLDIRVSRSSARLSWISRAEHAPRCQRVVRIRSSSSFMARERRQIGGPGGTDWLESLAHVPAAAAEERETEYEYELVVWAAEQVRGEFLETSWKAFWATLIEGRDVAEVAAELGVSPGSVYMSRSRLMARIRSKVREVMGG
jgi:RNA polymerase sigma-70 factor (ECF subfamily)